MDNIKMKLTEIMYKSVNWIELVRDVIFWGNRVKMIGFRKSGKFHDQTSDCQILKNDCAAWIYTNMSPQFKFL
jgi:hypothetical protein